MLVTEFQLLVIEVHYSGNFASSPLIPSNSKMQVRVRLRVLIENKTKQKDVAAEKFGTFSFAINAKLFQFSRFWLFNNANVYK